MKRRYGLIALAVVAALTVATPALGGPSAFDLAQKAFKQSTKAKTKAKRAGRRAAEAHRRITRANRTAGKVNRSRRNLRRRLVALESRSAYGAPQAAIQGRSSFSDARCRNDETGPNSAFEGEFQRCGDPVVIDVPESHQLLVNASISWFSLRGTTYSYSGQCRILENGIPTGPTASMGETDHTTTREAPGGSSLSVVLPARTGSTELAIGCREQVGNIDWVDMMISAVAIGPH